MTIKLEDIKSSTEEHDLSFVKVNRESIIMFKREGELSVDNVIQYTRKMAYSLNDLIDSKLSIFPESFKTGATFKMIVNALKGEVNRSSLEFTTLKVEEIFGDNALIPRSRVINSESTEKELIILKDLQKSTQDFVIDELYEKIKSFSLNLFVSYRMEEMSKSDNKPTPKSFLKIIK